MNALEKIVREIIAAQGAISVAAYMELALQHPEHGYYRVREPLGREGDFITAPEISQMFGEMVGVWCAQVWRKMGMPEAFALVECGPGHGTMMQDILRATAKVGGFHEAKQLCLIDSDQALRAKQAEKLGEYAPRYFDDIAQIPAMPMIVVANEFFDALPVRQFEQTFRGWAERMVTVENEVLVAGLRPLQEGELNLIPEAQRAAAPGTVVEISPKAQSMMRDMARAVAARKGAVLVVDYGYVAPSGTPSVQAVSKHAYASIFERPGEVDLTAHVDFAALGEVAQAAGLTVAPVVGQGEFLKNYGIEIRAESLKRNATPEQVVEIDTALHRLVDDAQMGNLFKVMDAFA